MTLTEQFQKKERIISVLRNTKPGTLVEISEKVVTSLDSNKGFFVEYDKVREVAVCNFNWGEKEMIDPLDIVRVGGRFV